VKKSEHLISKQTLKAIKVTPQRLELWTHRLRVAKNRFLVNFDCFQLFYKTLTSIGL